MKLPQRKHNRLPNFDYSAPGAYFLTICTKEHKCVLGHIVGASIARPPTVQLSEYGRIVEKTIQEIPKHYPAISVDHYTVMPNHIHLLLQIHTDTDGRAMLAPTMGNTILI